MSRAVQRHLAEPVEPDAHADSIMRDERDRARCVHEIIEEWAGRTPDAVAVVFRDQVLTYRELNDRANALAELLRNEGVIAGALVGISMKRSFEMIVSIFAVHKAGAAYVPLDPNLPSERLQFLVSNAGIGTVLVNGRVPDLGTARAIDLARPPTGAALRVDAERVLSKPDGDNLIYVIYTSGSTGEPKGVMVPHRGVVNWLVWMRRVFRVMPEDVVLKKAPLSFDVSAWELFLPLISGARLVLADSDRQFDQRYLADLMASTRVTIAQFVPSLMRVFLEQKALPDLGALRHVMCGGESLSPKLVSLFHERLTAELCNSYGPTEASIGVTRWICDRDDRRNFVPIGYAIDNSELYILDEKQQPVSIGVPGELYISGICLGQGYVGRPDLTAERFLPNPFSSDPEEKMYRTGDFCRWLEDGSIDYLGRTDDQVKIHGVRIEIAEVEKALAAHPAVDAAAVIVDTSSDDPVLAAYVVPARGKALSDQELRSFLRQKLPLPMVPSVFRFVTDLPVSANGKLDRKALQAQQLPVRGAPENGKNDVESRLIRIWTELLGRDDVGATSDFFDSGGDSFSAMQLYLRVEEEFHLPAIQEVLDPLTIGSLAALVRRSGSRNEPAVAIEDDALRTASGTNCRTAGIDDIEGIWRVCARAFPAYSDSTLEDFRALCRHRWLDNPCRADGDPLGWVVEAGHEIVGFHGLVPTRLWIGGRSVEAVAPTTWAVNPGHGSGGVALLTKYLEWGTPKFLINTTANSITSSMHETGNRGMLKVPIDDFDRRLLWVLDFKSLLQWKLAQQARSRLLRSVASSDWAVSVLARLAPPVFAFVGDLGFASRRSRGIRFKREELSIESVETFGSEFDDLWDRLKGNFDVTTERTSRVLNWRHRNIPRLLGSSHVLACRRNGVLEGYVALREPANTVPGHAVVTDLFYDPSRPEVMQSLMNAAFRHAAERSATVFEIFGFHPSVDAQLRTQRPYVFRRTQLERLGREKSLRSLLSVVFGRRVPRSATYWYRAPNSELAEICATGNWWPSGIDGDLNL